MIWPGPDGSLRDLLRWGILAILEELEVIRETMSENGDRTDLTYQVASLAEGLRDLEHRVELLEQHRNTISWFLGLSAAMTMGVLVAYIVGMLR